MGSIQLQHQARGLQEEDRRETAHDVYPILGRWTRMVGFQQRHELSIQLQAKQSQND
jgi:hypothetical protein